METRKKNPDTELATQEITLPEYPPTPQASDWREQFVEDYNTCCMCGTDLVFTHVTNFVEQTTVEEAFCECCKVRTRKADHSLQ